MRSAAPLGADLHNAIMFTGGSQHCLAFGNIYTDRLLAIDVDARLTSGYHWQSMPMVRRPDQNDVKILLLEHIPVIGVGSRPLVRCLALCCKIGSRGKH